MAAVVVSACDGIAACEDEDGAEKLCRICFAGEGEGGPEGTENTAAQQLISPCSCEGSQKYVHLGCLRRWQRAVQLGGSNHPDDRSNEDRHLICNVCKAKFDLPPQDRASLMAELAGVSTEAIVPGILLVSTRTNAHSAVDGGLNLALRAYVEFKAAHFREAVYVLTHCRPGPSGNGTCGDGSDIVIGVNLSRRLQPIPDLAALDGAISDAELRSYRQRGVEVVWMNGGPVEPRTVIALCHVSQLSYSTRAQLIANTPGVTELCAGVGDRSMEAVVCGSMAGVMAVAKASLEERREMSGRSSTVFAWAGFAQWTRSQLLGEMARGSWGWAQMNPSDVASSERQALWGGLRYSERLVWASDNELARDFARSLARAAPSSGEGAADPQADAVVAALAQQLEALHRGSPQAHRGSGGGIAGGGHPQSPGSSGAHARAQAAAAAAVAAGRVAARRPSAAGSGSPPTRENIGGSSARAVGHVSSSTMQACVLQ